MNLKALAYKLRRSDRTLWSLYVPETAAISAEI